MDDKFGYNLSTKVGEAWWHINKDRQTDKFDNVTQHTDKQPPLEESITKSFIIRAYLIFFSGKLWKCVAGKLIMQPLNTAYQITIPWCQFFLKSDGDRVSGTASSQCGKKKKKFVTGQISGLSPSFLWFNYFTVTICFVQTHSLTGTY